MTANQPIQVANFTIGAGHRPFVIAEMSGNHNQSLSRALEIVDAVADAGAHALKLQTYTPDTITFNGSSEEFYIRDAKSLWVDKNLYKLYEQAYTPWEWHKPIFEHAQKRGMIAFSSPFDTTAVDFLESLNVPLYKIASFENTDHILLKKIAQTGKPVIMSTGVASLADLDESVKVLRENGCKNLVLLKCTSTYPATSETTNLLTIPHMRQLFDLPIGLSDHTMGIGAAVAAVALGAVVLEKHVTLRRAEGGVDSAFSLEPDELKSLVIETERTSLAMGQVSYTLTPKEQKSLQFKRSLYVVHDVKTGEAFTPDNVRSIRPSNGLHTRYYEQVLTCFASQDIKAGTALHWDLIDKE
ncbi:pseudaminic acid synthase [Spirosoma sp. SC4-14]|uniref:pseudaminic acid synthase n=1 Tax=Spirosoma sp. SC4-14 TaxID=3128900 RepID=UPI0030D59FF3